MQDSGVSIDEQAAVQELSQVMCVRSAVLSVQLGCGQCCLTTLRVRREAGCRGARARGGAAAGAAAPCLRCNALCCAVLRCVATAAAAERHLLP
jgi:hypothetical protein